jgi:hypothetical protein
MCQLRPIWSSSSSPSDRVVAASKIKRISLKGSKKPERVACLLSCYSCSGLFGRVLNHTCLLHFFILFTFWVWRQRNPTRIFAVAVRIAIGIRHGGLLRLLVFCIRHEVLLHLFVLLSFPSINEMLWSLSWFDCCVFHHLLGAQHDLRRWLHLTPTI